MDKPWLRLLLLTLVGVIFLAGVFVHLNRTANHSAVWSRKNPEKTNPGEVHRAKSGQMDPGLRDRFLAVEAQQNELDNTVWLKEVLAEKHEDVFIQLWDDLRKTDDEFKILQDFPFTELTLGTPLQSQELEHGIKLTRLGAPAQKIEPDQWRQFLSEWKKDGYRIEQTEWRQPQFDFQSGSLAQSVIYLSAHIINQATSQRFILRGNLLVEWQNLADQNAQPIPQRISAAGIELLERRGEPAFQNVLSVAVEPAAGTTYIDPLILYDLDGDGLSEIILGCKNRVYRNRGGGKFESAVLCEKLSGSIFTCIVADFTGDGFADFLSANHQGLLLFAGDKNGQFNQPGRMVWAARESLFNPFVLTAGDIDGDGDLDIWLAQYKLPYVQGQMPTPYYDANDGFPSFLLINDGHGIFNDETESAGLAQKRFRRTYSASFVDLDDDGDLDLLVVSDFAGVDLYYNDGKGHFRDVTATDLDEPHAFGMAHTFGDFDLDGKIDFVVIGMNSFVAERLDYQHLGLKDSPEHQRMRPKMAFGNRMYFASDKGFSQRPAGEQVARSGWSWGAASFDFDNDGDLDIYIVNGHKSRETARDYDRQFWRHDIYAASSKHDPVMDIYFQSMARKLYGAGYSYGGYEKNRLFLNQSGKSFLEIGYLMGLAGELDCRNVVADDLDTDGKLDLLMTTYEVWPREQQGLHLFQNRRTAPGNWIGVRLREHGAGYSPVGAKVTVAAAGKKQIHQFVTGDSYRSQHANTAHFGLGSATSVDSIEVRWPNGITNRLSNPGINQYHNILPK